MVDRSLVRRTCNQRRGIRQDVTSHSTLIFHNFGRVRVVWGLLEFGFGVRVDFGVDFDLVEFGC